MGETMVKRHLFSNIRGKKKTRKPNEDVSHADASPLLYFHSPNEVNQQQSSIKFRASHKCECHKMGNEIFRATKWKRVATLQNENK